MQIGIEIFYFSRNYDAYIVIGSTTSVFISPISNTKPDGDYQRNYRC